MLYSAGSPADYIDQFEEGWRREKLLSIRAIIKQIEALTKTLIETRQR